MLRTATLYSYNLENRLVVADIARIERNAEGASRQVAISATYAYSQSGIRTRADSTTTVEGLAPYNTARIFLNDAQNFTGYSQILEEFSGTGLTKSYVIGDDVLSQSSGPSTPDTRHFLYDGHGSTRLLTDGTGLITDRFSFDAYGMTLGGDPNVTNPAATDLLYSGEQFDANLQMQYLRARYYDQGTGVFSSLDSFGGNNGDPQSLHKYAYCHGDPVNGIDPSGEFFFTLADMLAAVTVGMTLEIRHARAVLRTGTKLLERAFRYITNFAIRNLPRDRDNAAIVIHGVAPHEYGYATDFISELEGRVTNQDWYEFIWSGFALTGAVVPNMISHHEAVGSFREAMLTLQGKGYRKVNVLAHSWGTVISRDVLLGRVGPVNTWVTMGSPLPGDTPWPPAYPHSIRPGHEGRVMRLEKRTAAGGNR